MTYIRWRQNALGSHFASEAGKMTPQVIAVGVQGLCPARAMFIGVFVWRNHGSDGGVQLG